ncbi:MAG: hypothetical protein [Vetruanivirus porcinprimi]|uniref:Uncharacterized protein n=1 Tax=phage Lak_Megaphage_RVC_AP1_GC26 TaxID=3109224 RepID=A0ABZ0Z7K0_9CAUD|nr:MAG: hypothetical protein [phage Lak_Megaphage_RVC_AP1_GC26]
MNTRQKKALYESIMKSVAKTVKKALNETNKNLHEIKCLVTDFDNDIFNDTLYQGTYEECESYIFDFDEDTGKSEALTDILGILRQEKHINTNYFTIDDDEYDKENGRISFYITSRKTSEEYKIIFDIL